MDTTTHFHHHYSLQCSNNACRSLLLAFQSISIWYTQTRRVKNICCMTTSLICIFIVFTRFISAVNSWPGMTLWFKWKVMATHFYLLVRLTLSEQPNKYMKDQLTKHWPIKYCDKVLDQRLHHYKIWIDRVNSGPLTTDTPLCAKTEWQTKCCPIHNWDSMSEDWLIKY